MPIERAPVYPTMPAEPMTERQVESLISFQSIDEHRELVTDILGVGTDEQYRLTNADLQAKKDQQEFAQGVCYTHSRSTAELGGYILSTVKQMEDEFRKKTVLDIGSGIGRFGESVARNAKAEVTFLDRDPEVLSRISRRAGEIVLSDGLELPFEDERFDRVMAGFSSVHWARNPVESAQALNEAIRVTAVGGTTIIIPIIHSISPRRALLPVVLSERLPNGEFHPHDRYAVVWALQDLAVTNALFGLAERRFTDTTWLHTVQPVSKRVSLERYSAVIDKLNSVPTEVLNQNVAFGQQFMPPDAEERSPR